MDDTPTTGAPVDETGADLLVTEESTTETTTEPATAETPANEQTSDQQGDAEASVPAVDDKLVTLKGQGIEDVSNLTSREMSLLKSAYDNKADRDHASQQASELERSLNVPAPPNPDGEPDLVTNLAAEVQTLKMTQTVNNFFAGNPEAKALRGRHGEDSHRAP